MAIIVFRGDPQWQQAEKVCRNTFGRSLHDAGLEGQVLSAIERGEDPKRVVIQAKHDGTGPQQVLLS